eukprot:CAMPEP_0197251930 /NCGR_PEP_ID=MMETSP1429-20130617/59164_1 /TAXON_ID=49237 /ORGANISM="Chaetoceros  sp., Strain UNC1202" /LENGTH=220 /DNA_ID=CAMNT_0042714159 /DNA_START=111 /DNA_END=773 /DNA_ORIENTATION=+
MVSGGNAAVAHDILHHLHTIIPSHNGSYNRNPGLDKSIVDAIGATLGKFKNGKDRRMQEHAIIRTVCTVVASGMVENGEEYTNAVNDRLKVGLRMGQVAKELALDHKDDPEENKLADLINSSLKRKTRSDCGSKKPYRPRKGKGQGTDGNEKTHGNANEDDNDNEDGDDNEDGNGSESGYNSDFNLDLVLGGNSQVPGLLLHGDGKRNGDKNENVDGREK